MAKTYERRCEHCGERFVTSRPHTRFCPGKSCRADAWHAKHPDRDTRTRGKGKALRRVAKRRKRRPGSRPDTRYAVLRVHRAEFHLVGKCNAHDRESAVRELADGKRGLYIAVPVRSLALLDQEGRPDGR